MFAIPIIFNKFFTVVAKDASIIFLPGISTIPALGHSFAIILNASLALLLILFLATAPPNFLLVIMPNFSSSSGKTNNIPAVPLIFSPRPRISLNSSSFLIVFIRLMTYGPFFFFWPARAFRRTILTSPETRVFFFSAFYAADMFAYNNPYFYYTFGISRCQRHFFLEKIFFASFSFPAYQQVINLLDFLSTIW